jgi:hypothetical protein
MHTGSSLQSRFVCGVKRAAAHRATFGNVSVKEKLVGGGVTLARLRASRDLSGGMA